MAKSIESFDDTLTVGELRILLAECDNTDELSFCQKTLFITKSSPYSNDAEYIDKVERDY